MNEQTQKMLEALAAKLGTTVEYLWHVLIRQARISAIEDILQYLLVGVGVYVMVRIHRRVVPSLGDFDDHPMRWVGIVLGWAFTGLLVVVAFFAFPDTITKFVNPEYWALTQVLNTVR